VCSGQCCGRQFYGKTESGSVCPLPKNPQVLLPLLADQVMIIFILTTFSLSSSRHVIMPWSIGYKLLELRSINHNQIIMTY
jgi:hypothetical protein